MVIITNVDCICLNINIILILRTINSGWVISWLTPNNTSVYLWPAKRLQGISWLGCYWSLVYGLTQTVSRYSSTVYVNMDIPTWCFFSYELSFQSSQMCCMRLNSGKLNGYCSNWDSALCTWKHSNIVGTLWHGALPCWKKTISSWEDKLFLRFQLIHNDVHVVQFLLPILLQPRIPETPMRTSRKHNSASTGLCVTCLYTGWIKSSSGIGVSQHCHQQNKDSSNQATLSLIHGPVMFPHPVYSSIQNMVLRCYLLVKICTDKKKRN